ncbi:DNA polymerase delta subunit 3 [Esox lucius]|uniref:DNA polymerase delta subunit 3 n=1 Tax=Esox lucius TaxID=8010 RepID=A0A3P8YT51_ESOLU|nr:DNA polymerase delta subunit 3 [Esox lucius]
MDELYLDNIDEFVNDQNKIVTYKWLSLTLGVHVNVAKQMLFHYLDQKRKESSAQLHATYLVSGKIVENGTTGHKVSVVREDQLEEAKSKMSLTVSVHVYSVQKAVLKDSGPLYSADYDAVKDNLRSSCRYSAIRCADAVPMSSSEVQLARETKQAPAPDTEHIKSGINAHSALASKPASKQPKGIMGMFVSKNVSKNQESDKEIKLEQKEDAPVVEPSKTKPAVKTNPVRNFFGKQSGKKPDKSIKEEVDVAQASSSKDNQASSPPPKAESPVKEEPPKEAVLDKDIRSKTKRPERSDNEEKDEGQKKKRRRIKKPQADSSEDEASPPRWLEQREPSPSPESQVKKEPAAVSLSDSMQGRSDSKTRKRRRVLKSHTFVDDEGCMVTEKGYASESYSESEEDFKASKQTGKNPTPPKPIGKKDDEKKSKKTATASNKSTKQASIMGFFQKK